MSVCSADSVQRHLDCITEVGKRYGLELNLGKTVLMRIRSHEDIFGSDGKALDVKQQAVYLGALLCTNGRPDVELTRRIGEAARVFNKLAAIWKHANISKRRKCDIFQSCIVSKLLYGLESLLLLQADRRRLDAFYVQCLRKISRIQHSFYSRVSNADVLAQFSVPPLSRILAKRQLILFGKICREPNSSLTRRITFNDDECTPRVWGSKRRVGRPCLRWIPTMYAMALEIAQGCPDQLRQLTASDKVWKNQVFHPGAAS